MSEKTRSFQQVLRRWRLLVGKYKLSWNQFEAINLSELNEYVKRGSISPPAYAVAMEPTNPPLMPWELYLESNLRMFATRRIVATQSVEINDPTSRDVAVRAAFESVLLADFIDLYSHSVFGKRFPGRKLAQMTWRSVPFMALGILIGQIDRAKIQCEAQAKALNSDLFINYGEFPILELLLRISAHFFGIKIDRNFVHIPMEDCTALLLKNWRSPADVFHPLLISLCDLHMERSFQQSRDYPIDFDDGIWILFPVEVLAILEMRRLIGLPSLAIEHPLIEKFYSLNIPIKSENIDPLIQDVYLRMRSKGFDEQSILLKHL